MSHQRSITPANPNPPAPDEAEAERLADLASYGILDTKPESEFDGIVALARVLFDTPIAAITLVDGDRQWFKAQAGLDVAQTAREDSFCSHAMENGGVFVVPDAQQDSRFSGNRLVTGEPNIRFYAGAPLRSANGHNLGAVCVISSDPRGEFSSGDRKKLEILANIVQNEMELKKRAQQAHKMLVDKDMALRDAHFRIKNSLEYATLLAEAQDAGTPTEKLAVLAMTAWKQYTEAGGILNSSVKALRERMSAAEYRDMLALMPGFVI
jgi:GAF domain-containing protein